MNTKEIIQVYLKCPNCNEMMEIEQRNCDIFRHGHMKDSLKQIPPHLSKELCEQLIEKSLIYGCGKPFELYYEDNELKAKICDYT